MPSVEEIAYRESVRALDGQARDLENVRSHVSMVLTAGGVGIAFFASQHPGRGDAFIIGAGAFTVVALTAVLAYRAITFAWDFDTYDLVNTYVDADPPRAEAFMMRELAVHAGDDYLANKKRLDRLQGIQSIALLAFGVEVLALMFHLGLE